MVFFFPALGLELKYRFFLDLEPTEMLDKNYTIVSLGS